MPATHEKTLRVRGYRELLRAYALADKTIRRQMRARLRKVAEPVKEDAQKRSVAEVRNIGPKWSQMRIGVTTRSVYVAEKERGRHTGPALARPNLATLLMDRAMSPALNANIDRARHEFEDLLYDAGREWERV